MKNNIVNHMGNKAAIQTIDGNTVVFDKNGEVIFNRPRSQQMIAIAHTLYMAEKYYDHYIEIERKKSLE